MLYEVFMYLGLQDNLMKGLLQKETTFALSNIIPLYRSMGGGRPVRIGG